MDLADAVASLGGIASLEQLRSRGFGRGEILVARRAGRLLSVRRGWCATHDADRDAIEAIRIRGQATCITATAALGLWTNGDGRLHVAVPHSASRLNPRREGAPPATDDPTVVLHWRSRTAAATAARPPLREVLLHVVECQPPDLALAVLDSALHQQRCSIGWMERVLATSMRGRRLVGHLDPLAGAGGESIVRWRLRAAGIEVRSQHWVPGLGPRDFLVGDRLILEIDGREHHALQAGFARDRHLDRELQRRGYDVLRFAYAEVLGDWGRVLDSIRAFVSADRHRCRGTPS